MNRVYDPALNDIRTGAKAYGVKHGASDNASGVTRVYTMDMKWEILITDSVADRNSDTAALSVVNALHSKADDILNQIFLTKLSLPSIVLIVDQPRISEPEVLPNGLALIRVGFNVKYRQAIA
jgi:hypothetical protein